MVARRRRKRSLPPPRHRALELLASSRDGCTEAIMIAHGFTVPQMVELVRTGLATAHTPARDRRQTQDRNCVHEDYRGRPAGARGGCQAVTSLVLKGATASPPSGEWDDDD